MKKGLLLYQRINLIQLISILIIMSLFNVYSFYFDWNNEMARMGTQTVSLKERLVNSLSGPLWNLDRDECGRLMASELNDTYVYAAELRQNGKFWLGKIEDEKGKIGDIADPDSVQASLKKAYTLISERVMSTGGSSSSATEIGELVIYITDAPVRTFATRLLLQNILQTAALVFLVCLITFVILRLFLNGPLKQITATATRIASGELELKAEVSGPAEIATLAEAFNSMTSQLFNNTQGLANTNAMLTDIIKLSREIIQKLNSTSKEIEAATQEQTSAANEQASGITEVSATLEELTITAKQITKNVGELVFASEESVKSLQESERQLTQSVEQLEDVGKISANNTAQIGELGKRSAIINEMVELIKEVANKTNILSINASIEASRSGEAGTGFSVVAAEIRELSKETINSAKKVEEAARQIQDFLNSIIIASESESVKVLDCGKTIKSVFRNIDDTVTKIKNNYTFAQKIDVSIKQQENGSRQAADTMRQMSEIARQSAETTRQTLVAVKDIVNYSLELEDTVKKCKSEDDKQG